MAEDIPRLEGESSEDDDSSSSLNNLELFDKDENDNLINIE